MSESTPTGRFLLEELNRVEHTADTRHELLTRQIAELTVSQRATKKAVDEVGEMSHARSSQWSILQETVAAQGDELRRNSEATSRVERNTAGAVDLLQNIEALVKTLGWVGKALEGLGKVIAVLGALTGAFFAFKAWFLK